MTISSQALITLQENYTDNSRFITKSLLMKDIFNKVRTVAQLDKHVILIGEVGVGKKRLAHTIHKSSRRAEGPFHSFYCIDLDESEFRDAFWEQIYFENEHLSLKYNVLEKASNGILFLDQFSELSDTLMLNMINSYIHGSKQLFRYNSGASPRLIMSVNQNAYKQLSQTAVWDQLLILLNPISIVLPPLRERKEDIPVLIEAILEEIRSSEPDCRKVRIASDTLRKCMAYDWPGNIRQLKNAILQGMVLSHCDVIEDHHLPFSMNWELP